MFTQHKSINDTCVLPFVFIILGIFRLDERNKSQKDGRQQREEWEEKKEKPS